MQVLLTSSDVSDFLKRANYLQIAQEHDRKLIDATQQAKNDYQNQKQIFQDEKQKVEALKKQLQDYSAQLDQEKAGKQTLLSQTQGSESNYQKLLAQAQAQLSGFTHFATSQGGASLPPTALLKQDVS
jgi:peptidoglycan hydrolase CwlO-like protein